MLFQTHDSLFPMSPNSLYHMFRFVLSETCCDLCSKLTYIMQIMSSTKHVQSAHISIPAEVREFICIMHFPHAGSFSFALNKLV